MKIKTETTYVCEYCGEEFEEEDKELAEEHEAIEKALSECRFWDRNIIELKHVGVNSVPDCAYYFYAPDILHIEAIAIWHEFWGIDFPTEFPTGGMWFYDESTENWHSVSDVKQRLHEIEKLAV